MAEARVKAVITAEDRASAVIGNVSSSFSKMAGAVAVGELAVTGITSAFSKLKDAGKFALESASDFEQNRIAFDTMLGSAEKAKVLLKQVSDFAAKTPFELPEVVQGARQLLAYNVAAEQIIPTFTMLGNLAAGVGKDKLPQLILAFGQVKAATKLTGMELRQFSEAGVPLLQALVDQLNRTGGSMVKVGKAVKATDIGELNDKLKIAKQRFAEASASGKAKQSTLMSLQNTIQNYEQKLASATKGTTGFAKATKVTAAQVTEMISEGKISFDQVQQALQGMTGEGGKFFGLMERQSQTFGGVMSNLRDNFGRFARELIGINDQGDIRQGSIFYYLQRGAQSFLEWTNANREHMIGFFTQLMNTGKTWGQDFIRTIGDAVEWVRMQWEHMTTYIANDQRAQYVFDIIRGIMADIAQVVRENLIPEITRLARLLHPYLDDVLKIVGAVAVTAFVGFIATLDVVIRLISKGIDLLNDFIGIFHKVKDTSDDFFSGLVSKIPGIKNIGRASGGPVTGGSPYIVGERGPELFVPQSSGQIVPNHRLTPTSGGNTTINLSVNVGTFVGTEMEKRKLAEELMRAWNDLQSARGTSMAQAVRG